MPTFLFIVLVLIWGLAFRYIKTPFKQSAFKGALTGFLVVGSAEWWRSTIFVPEPHYDYGCYIETQCRRGCTDVFKNENGELEYYSDRWDSDFSPKDVEVGSCVYIKHYHFLGEKFILSVQKANPNEDTNPVTVE